jgi:N-acetylglucosamine-6-phosphate deacetylase
MVISGARYFGGDFRFHYGDIHVEDGRFAAVAERSGEVPAGCDMVVPGMVDIHLHGNSGADFSDGDDEGLKTIARYLALSGTTSFCAATMSLPEAALEKACKSAARFCKAAPMGCAVLRGITIEGPFICEAKKGAHEACFLRRPDAAMLSRLQQAAGGLIRIACVAPELPGAMEYIHAVNDMGIAVSAAHTDARYEEAAAGFDAGITHLTHCSTRCHRCCTASRA